jgi:hypothetical protein
MKTQIMNHKQMEQQVETKPAASTAGSEHVRAAGHMRHKVSEVDPLSVEIHPECLLSQPTKMTSEMHAGGHGDAGIPKLTDQLRDYCCSVVLISGSVETALMATGIDSRQYRRMVRKVGEGGGTSEERRFVRAVECAEGARKMKVEQMLREHKNPNAQKWLLAHKT